MIRRTIAAVLLAGLSSPLLAAVQFANTGQAYDQAASLSTGKSLSTMYDGGAAHGSSVQVPAPGASATDATAAQNAPSVQAPAISSAESLKVPSPDKDGGKSGLFGFSRRSLLYGSGGAALGAIAGSPGGVVGALVGALIGFAIGYLLSKILR